MVHRKHHVKHLPAEEEPAEGTEKGPEKQRVWELGVAVGDVKLHEEGSVSAAEPPSAAMWSDGQKTCSWLQSCLLVMEERRSRPCLSSLGLFSPQLGFVGKALSFSGHPVCPHNPRTSTAAFPFHTFG